MTKPSPDLGVILVAPVADSSLGPLVELLGLLQAAGYQVIQVNGEDNTIAAAETNPPDLILLAIDQFDTAAMRLCHRLKKRSQTRQVAVAVVGQDQALARRLRAFEFGVVDYLDQTLWAEEAAARIRAQVTTHRLQRRLRQQAQRAVSGGSATNLLADLQKALRRQAQLLQAKNRQLQQEMQEREQAQQALRLEQQKSEQLLLNILPRAVVDRLKQLEGSLAERFDDVTILFADIVNFTPLAAQISPLELVNWLNQIFSAFDRLAEQYQLEKIKTIGDAYMVVGGMPLPCPDHAEAVMEMALAMQEAATHITRNDGQEFQLRIGINTGPVVAGVIGIKKFSYDLWGNAVNIASRMESQGIPGKIQITEATYQRLRHRYAFEQVDQVLVKGHGYLTTYQYVGPGQKD
jgi:adenylate cyclase